MWLDDISFPNLCTVITPLPLRPEHILQVICSFYFCPIYGPGGPVEPQGVLGWILLENGVPQGMLLGFGSCVVQSSVLHFALD